MAKFHVAQNNFNGGVLGKLLLDRYDLPSYANAIKFGKNAFPLTEGPLTKRPGSIYVADVLNNAKARLISFRFSKDVKYVLEFTPNKIRFFKNRALLNYTLDTSFTEAMYNDIYTAQLSDLLLMVSGNMFPQQLKRTNDTNWSINKIDFYDGPYGDTNVTDTELYCSGKTGSVNLNSTTDLFSANDVGRHWRLRSGNGWAWGVCTSYVNAKQIVITVKEGEMPVSPYQTKLWKKGLFSDSDGNYPTTVSLHAKRLWLGGFKNNPTLIIASKSSDFFNFAPTDISTGAIGENNSISINLSQSGVSDIQFIAGKEGTQEEFFHTFNALHEANKQIIISSDRPPKEIPTLEDRLRSRFEMGLITDIQPPDFETRIAILRKKAQLENINVPNEVMTYIAKYIKSNIRELEGALTRVVAYSSLTNKNISLELATEALKDIISNPKSEEITVNRIKEKVSEAFNIKMDDFNSKKRTRTIAYPRQIAMYICRELTDLSLPKIGSEFGGRDHTTVIHAHDKISKDIEENQQIKDKIDKIISDLKG